MLLPAVVCLHLGHINQDVATAFCMLLRLFFLGRSTSCEVSKHTTLQHSKKTFPNHVTIFRAGNSMQLSLIRDINSSFWLVVVQFYFRLVNCASFFY